MSKSSSPASVDSCSLSKSWCLPSKASKLRMNEVKARNRLWEKQHDSDNGSWLKLFVLLKVVLGGRWNKTSSGQKVTSLNIKTQKGLRRERQWRTVSTPLTTAFKVPLSKSLIWAAHLQTADDWGRIRLHKSKLLHESMAKLVQSQPFLD